MKREDSNHVKNYFNCAYDNVHNINNIDAKFRRSC